MAVQPITHATDCFSSIIEVEHQADKHGHILCPFIRVPAVLPELIDLGGELVDPLVALAQ
jgi:hypothetical protein